MEDGQVHLKNQRVKGLTKEVYIDVEDYVI